MPTPFELRFNVLAMARDLLIDEYHIHRDAALESWRSDCNSAERRGENNPPMPTLKSFPSEKEILEKASKLNEFVATAK